MSSLHSKDNNCELKDKSSRSTAAFPSVLIALIALSVIAWVGIKLMQPSPIPPVATGSEVSPSSVQEPLQRASDDAIDTKLKAPGSADSIALASNESDPVCGMNPQRSAMRVEAEFADGDLVAFDSLACYYEYAETIARSSPVTERIVAYDTYRLEHPVLLNFSDAVWLIDLDGSVPGAMPPGAAAFRTLADAEKAMGNLGGKLASASEMQTYIYEFLRGNGILD